MRIPVPFLGGPISAVLLLLAFEPQGHAALGWIALIPFFHSLQRHRTNSGMRFAHGFFFGVILAAASLSWFPAVMMEDFHPASSPRLWGMVRAVTCWTGISLSFGAFALAAGPLLRSPRVLTALVGLPILWTGLEVLRGPFFPFPGVWPIPVGWIANWLSLGYALSPQTPEAQPAALFGIYGLSMAMAASSTAFSLLLREFRLERQLWLALLGCALPLACHGYGRLVLPETAPGGTVEVAVAAQERAELQSLIDLTLSMERQRPALVVWPAVPVLSIDRANSKPEGEPHVSPDLFRDFVRQGQPTVIAGARADGDAREHGDTEAGALDERPHHAASFGEYVVIVNAEGSVLGTLYSDRGGPSRGARGHPALPFDCPSGRVGVGLGFDFDSPSRARKLSARGAGLLISVTRDGAVWGKRGTRQHASMQQFRAIENRRWLVRSSGTNAFIADPFGRLAFHLRDVEGVGGHGVEFLQERSLYTRWGWGIEPASLSGASWILVWTLVGWVKRPRRRR